MTVEVRHWTLDVPRWTGAPLRIAMVADVHACWPWMTPARVGRIVDQVNALGCDLIALLGDYPGHVVPARAVARDGVAAQLARLDAALGTYAVFGNHDWMDDPQAERGKTPQTHWHRAFATQGIAILENAHIALVHKGMDFVLTGVGSQRAFKRRRAAGDWGVDDLTRALDGADPTAFKILLAHEPDIFADLPDGVDLTLSGHTHGGQVRLFGRTPVVPSTFGSRYAYGHIRENGRDLVVSGGLGYSGLPIRIGRPPEITVVTLT